ncbi:hypothetical protein WDU94_010768 [Cyamophila willieti]
MKQYLVMLIIPAVFAWNDFDPYTDPRYDMQHLLDMDLCPPGNDSLCLLRVREVAYKYRHVNEKVDADCEHDKELPNVPRVCWIRHRKHFGFPNFQTRTIWEMQCWLDTTVKPKPKTKCRAIQIDYS